MANKFIRFICYYYNFDGRIMVCFKVVEFAECTLHSFARCFLDAECKPLSATAGLPCSRQ